MDIIGTTFSLTLGAWRVCFNFKVEEVRDDVPVARERPPHRLLVAKESQRTR